jgi:NAD-dependent dihydropyrimidine dehydrogenase PreA subunit
MITRLGFDTLTQWWRSESNTSESDRNTNCNNDDNRAVTITNMAVVVNSECCSGCKVMMGR